MADKVPVRHRKEIFDWEVTFFTSKKTTNVCQQLCPFLEEKQTWFQETLLQQINIITTYLGEAMLFPGPPFL